MPRNPTGGTPVPPDPSGFRVKFLLSSLARDQVVGAVGGDLHVGKFADGEGLGDVDAAVDVGGVGGAAGVAGGFD